MTQPTAEALSLLEYRLSAVTIGHLALRYAMAWDTPPSLEIYFDGRQVIEGKATAFTNAAIESAIMHSRALLEFLGLGSKTQIQLCECSSRRDDDLCIERFTGLSKISVQQVVNAYPGPSAEAEAALAYVVYLANKGLAHTTTSFSRHDEGAKLLEIAFRGIPVLVVNAFYVPLGIQPPSYELRGRKHPV